MSRTRIRYLYTVVDQRAGDHDLPLMAVSIHHGVVQRDVLTEDLPRVEDLSSYKICRSGDLVLNRMRAFQGAVGLSSQDGLVSPDYLVLRPRSDVSSRYLHYLFRSKWFVGEMTSRLRGIGNTQSGSVRTPRINPEDLGDILIDIPDFNEQRRIADFLDVEMNKVNRVVVVSEHMRDLLTLKRERTIERILGIDSSPSMLPLKYAVSSVKVGIVIKPADWYVDTGGIYALRGVNIKPGHIDSTDLIQISQAGHSTNIKSRLLSGDVVVVRTGQAGTASVVPDKFDGCNCIDLLIIRPGLLTNSSFLAYYINSSYAQEKIAQHSVGSIQTHFNVDSMRNLDFPAIAYREQSRRVSILDEKISDLDRLDSYLERQFALLVERRQALITESVTGQIDVTTVQGFGPSGSAVT